MVPPKLYFIKIVMKHSILLFLLSISFPTIYSQNSKPDSLTIYVKLTPDSTKTYTAPEERCFRKKSYIHRLHLDHPKNFHLALQRDQNRKIIGFLPYLIEEMKANKIVGKDARDNKTPYDYQELLEDMYILEGLAQDPLPDTLNPSRVQWSKLATYIDLITSECFDQDYSRNRRITYSVRLLYCDPHFPKDIYGVAIFPLPDVSPLLEGILLRNGWNALEMIHDCQYHSIRFKPEEDRIKTREKDRRY